MGKLRAQPQPTERPAFLGRRGRRPLQIRMKQGLKSGGIFTQGGNAKSRFTSTSSREKTTWFDPMLPA